MVLKNGLPKIFNDKLAGFAKARGYEPAELEFSSSGGDEIRIAAEENAALFGGNLAFSSRFQCARSDEGWNAPSEVAKSSRIRLAGRCHDEFGTALQAAERRRVLGRGLPLQFGAQKAPAPHLSRRPRRLPSEASRQMARGPIPWRGAHRVLPPGMRSGVRLPSAGPSSRTDCPGSSAVIFGESLPSLTAVMKNSSVGASGAEAME